MAADKRKRNKLLTGILVFGILGYFLVAIAGMVLMLEFKGYRGYSGYVLGFGLSTIFAIANMLGVILIMRWRKNGFYLILLSLLLSAVIDYNLFEEHFAVSSVYFIACLLGFAALQLRSNGKSTWSQLQPGWDYKHNRHLIQIFAVICLSIFILTIFFYGSILRRKMHSQSQPAEIAKVEPRHDTYVPQHGNDDITPAPISEAAPVADSIPRPVSDEKFNKDQDKKGQSKEKKKENSPKSRAQELTAAAEYLDTHDVWDQKEMSYYPELKDLNYQIASCIKKGHCNLPYNLVKESKKLQKLMHLLDEYEDINEGKRERTDKELYHCIHDTNRINYTKLIHCIERAIILAHHDK